jgi:hypothetical protein
MLFEVYFDKTGEFRGQNLKGSCLEKLLTLQTVKKCEPSISFIRRALQPYKEHLLFLPSTDPETVALDLIVKKSDPPLVKSLTLNGRELLSREDKAEEWLSNRVWKLSHISFTVNHLKASLADAWSVPLLQLEINCRQKIDAETEYRLPKGVFIKWPKQE